MGQYQSSNIHVTGVSEKKEEIDCFSADKKLEELGTSRPALKEILKEALKVEEKYQRETWNYRSKE